MHRNHEAVWHLRAPVLRALFQQLSDPGMRDHRVSVSQALALAAHVERIDSDFLHESIQQPLPSIEIRIPLSWSTSVKSISRC